MRTFIGKLYVNIQDNKHKKKSVKGDSKTEYTLISQSPSSNSQIVPFLLYRSQINTRGGDELTTSKEKEESNQPTKLKEHICSCSTIQAVR